MAIDPVLPVTPSHRVLSPVGAPADSAAALLATAQAALAEGAAVLGDMVEGSVGEPDLTEKADSGRLAAAAATATAPELPVADRLAAAVRSASAVAAPRQDGLAPLMADVAVALERVETPPPVRQAAWVLMESALPAQTPVTPAVLREAVRRSGVFLEADLARALAHEAKTPENAPPRPAGPSRDIKAALLVFRAVVSTWVAQTPQPPPGATEAMSETGPTRPAQTPPPEGRLPLAAATPSLRPSPAGPTAAPANAAPGTAQPTPINPGPLLQRPGVERMTPLSPAPALGQSEAALDPPEVAEADGLAPKTVEPEAARLPTSPRAPVLERPQLPTAAPLTLPGAAPPTPSPPPTTAAAVMLMAGLIDDERLPAPVVADEPAPRELLDAARSRPAPRPPPPYAGGPTSAQPARPSDLPKDLAPGDLARRLLKDVGGALARQELLQIASLPEARPEGRPEPDRPVEARGARWVMDLPFQTPQGVSVAQFEISRDGGGGGGSGGGEVERTWRARFSLDVEPLGPVHVQVALTGVQTRVSLWAERPESMARLRAGEETLGAALRQADLSPEVAVHAGAPHTAPSAPGRFVDRAS